MNKTEQAMYDRATEVCKNLEKKYINLHELANVLNGYVRAYKIAQVEISPEVIEKIATKMINI